MEPVEVGRRAVAVLIDSILLFVAGYIIALATGGTTLHGFNIQGGPAFLWFSIALAYYVIMEALSGATLGKRAMGLKMVKEGGGAPDWQASIVRNVMRIADGLFFYLVAAIAVWVSKGKQRLGDMAAPNYKIDSVVLKAGRLANRVEFSLCKPNAGWPEGDYRVALFIDDKPAGDVKFRVGP